MLVFSQGVTKHSRIANSFLWMLKISKVLEETGISYCFPWAYENFGNYLRSDSNWMQKNEFANAIFFTLFNTTLDAESISKVSAKLIESYCLENNISYEYNMKIIYKNNTNKVLFINGPVHFDSLEILSVLNNFDLVICHEPYDFIFDIVNSDDYNYKNFIPQNNLFIQQLIYVNSRSSGKQNIGFHIRKGDYEFWEGGKYYYEDDFWVNLYKEKESPDKNIWIFTNQQDSSILNTLGSLGAIISNGTFEHDFVRMMFMKDIYGPPSTFPPMALNISSKYYSFKNFYHYLPPKF